MRGMIRTLALGAVAVAATATGAVAQNYYGNSGYGTYYGNGNGGYYSDGPGYYGRHGRYFGNDQYGSGPIVQPPVVQPYAPPYSYYSNNSGYGTTEQRGWGSGGGAAYDRGYNSAYWGR